MTNEISLSDTQIVEGCSLTATGARFSGEITFEQWSDAGRFLRSIEGAIQFALGDWLNHGDLAFGDKYSQALENSDYQFQTLANYSWVCSKVAPDVRIAGLSFSHHVVVAKFEQNQQRTFLQYAFKECVNRKGNYSVAEFKAWVLAQVKDAGDESGQQQQIGLPKTDDFKNALIFIRDLCDETKLSAIPSKVEIGAMIGALTAIKQECVKIVGVKRQCP